VEEGGGTEGPREAHSRVPFDPSRLV